MIFFSHFGFSPLTLKLDGIVLENSCSLLSRNGTPPQHHAPLTFYLCSLAGSIRKNLFSKCSILSRLSVDDVTLLNSASKGLKKSSYERFDEIP